jgi:Ser/Thr protein kinase RdoA (MazF antagonist)
MFVKLRNRLFILQVYVFIILVITNFHPLILFAMLGSVFTAYGLKEDVFKVTPFGNGLINHTWRLKNGHHDYILQSINENVFKNPIYIAQNIRLIAEYLKEKYPNYIFTEPVQTIGGEEMFVYNKSHFRLFPFIKNSHTIDVTDNAQQAYEAARQFGKFTRLLSGIDISKLKITLPDFHNLTLRYQQFKTALLNGNKERIKKCKESIQFIEEQAYIVREFHKITTDANFRLRVTHHDTKISNILFDEHNKGICVIDLDTVMPGYFISDVGDMMRTYLSPVSEEEKDFSKISIRSDFVEAIIDGYGSEMNHELSLTEKRHFLYAGKFMIYMQAIRFLADYINNDIYYGEKYPDHNLVRANNQIVLLQKLIAYE